MNLRDPFITCIVVIVLCGTAFVAEKGDLPHIETARPDYPVVHEPGRMVINTASRMFSWNSSSKAAFAGAYEAHIEGPLPPPFSIHVNVEETARYMRDELNIIPEAWKTV